MNRQRLLTLAVAANAVLTIVALIRIYTVSNIIQTNLAALSGNLQQLGTDVAQLNEQVRRASSSVSDLTDGSLQAVHTTVNHLNANLADLDTSVANLQGFTKEQTEDHGALSQSISGFAGTLHSTGAEVIAASTTDGGPVANAMNDYKRDLSEAGNWVERENTDGGIHAAITHYAGTVESAGQVVSDATQSYRSDLKSAGQSVVKAGEEGGVLASAQAAYKTALTAASAKASDQVRDRLDHFFQDNQPSLSKELLKKIDAKCQCSCGSASALASTTTPAAQAPAAAHAP